MLLNFYSFLRFSTAGSSPRSGRSMGVILGVCVGVAMGAGDKALAQLEPPPPLRIGYISELPVSWSTGLADPVHSIARTLGGTFVKPLDEEFPLPIDNLMAAASWEELASQIQLGSNAGADLFPIQSYEYLESGRNLKIKPLLLAVRNDHWQTTFQILVSPNSGIQTLGDMKGRKVLVHRDGCGYLVDYFLDNQIAKKTGSAPRGFARFQTVTQPREAILPVFFGEADACVVSTAAFQKVAQENPSQINQRVRPLQDIEYLELPSQVVVCRTDMPEDKQRLVREYASKLNWTFGGDAGTFIPAEEIAFDHLRSLLAERTQPFRSDPPVPAPPGAKFQSSTPSPVKPVRRP